MSSAELTALRNGLEIAASPVNPAEMHHFVNDIDYMLTSVDTDRIRHLSFVVNDIPFHVTHDRDTGDSESSVCVQALLGYLPYSIEARENRQAILAILEATHVLFHVRFGLDHQGRIFAAGYFASDTIKAPNFIFYPLTLFFQEAQPFIGLIGEYL